MSKKRNKSKSGKADEIKDKLSHKIAGLLNANFDKAYSVSQITKKLGFRRKDYNREIPFVVNLLEKQGKISMLSNGSYKGNHEPDFVVGKVDHVNARFAYVITPDEEEDIYIAAKDLKSAMDGDTVRVAIKDKRHGKHREGYVLEVESHGKDQIVGRIEFSPRFAFVIADNRKIHQDIFISLTDTNGATHNDKVIVKITQWPSNDKSPEGEVIRVLGKAGENNAEIHSIMAEFDLPFEFPKHIEEEAEAISEKISQKEIDKRRDFRDVLTFTIDPADAKDFDDAISYKPLDNGNIEVGVHIADVTHYVMTGTALEKEAYDRATSVYLVDRTVPMLPEKLSNGLCSLRPNEDKLTFAAVFEMDENGGVVNEWFGRTIIHSDRRFAYEDAQEGIETGEGDYAKELQTLNGMAKKLRERRFGQGAVNFETTEVKFKLDENGKPLGVFPKVRKDAHKLIEEFMLMANRQVARFVYNKKKGEEKLTFVYRTHDYPDPEKIDTFANFARRFGHEMHTEEHAVSKSLNRLMTEIECKPEEKEYIKHSIR